MTSTGFYPKNTSSSSKVNALLEKLEQCLRQNELNLLLFLLDMCYQNFGNALTTTKLPNPVRSDNLTTTIYEKLMAIKSKNLEFQIKLLNFKATLAKQYPKKRQTTYQQKYAETMESIREKSLGIREKLSRLRSYSGREVRAGSSQDWRAREASSSLKEVTELLTHETVKLKTEFSILRESCSKNQSFI